MSRPVEFAALGVLLAGYLTLLVHLARITGVTIDEPSHIVSSILYWEGNDHLKPRDMPPLIKITAGWAAARAGFRIVEESHKAWELQHEWPVAQDMMGRTPRRVLKPAMFQSRLPLLLFPLGTVLLLWWWARVLFGPGVALGAAALFVLEPTALGHAPLFKNDHAATFTYLLFCFCAWCYAQAPKWTRVLALAVALALACMAKLSLLVLLPITAFLLIARRSWAALLLPGVTWLILVAACQGELRWVYGVPLPGPMDDGAAALLSNASGNNSVYLLGQIWPQGHRAYFLIAALVKTPEALLLLLIGAIGLTLGRLFRGKIGWLDLFWLAPGPLYLGMASMTNLQFGFRLVLPALPFALLLAASLLQVWLQSRWRLLAVLPIAVMAIAAVLQYPHYLSSFNWASGGPRNATRYLSDSNIDWGQDLESLRRYVQQNKIPRIHVSYLGFDSLFAHLRPDEVEWINPPYHQPPIKELQPAPGVYAISVNLLTGQFFEEEWRNYYRAFRERQPIGYAGHSIYIYRIP